MHPANLLGIAAGAATRIGGGGEGGGRYTVSLVMLFCPIFFRCLALSLSCSLSLLLLFFFLSFFSLSLSLSVFLSSFSLSLSLRGTGRAGAGGVAASRWRTARGRSGRRTGKDSNIVMIQ